MGRRQPMSLSLARSGPARAQPGAHVGAATGSSAAGGAAEPLRISVVILTERTPDLLCRCLTAVVSQGLERGAYEVIVVEDGRSADTEAVVEAFRRNVDSPVLRLVRPRSGLGPARARNAGWRAAYGKIVAFTSDDAVPDRDWLARGERALRPELVAVCGRVVAAGAAAVGSQAVASASDAGPTESAELVAANAFVRRSALLAVAGFDERFSQSWREDSDLQFRLLRDAGAVGRSDDAVVVRVPRPAPWGTCLQQQRKVFFDALLYKKHPRLYRERIRPAPPWSDYAIVGLTLAAPLLWAADVPGSAIVSLLLAFAATLRSAWQRLRRHRRPAERVAEVVLTAPLLPFLSVYWRLRGAIHFRVLFL